MNFLFLDTVGYESALRLSGHHYARLLIARGHRVLSLSAPVTPFHLLARKSRETIARRFENHRAGFIQAPGGVLHYVPRAWLPVRKPFPLDRPWALRLAARGYRRDVIARFEAMDFEPDVVSIQNMMFHPLAREFPRAVLHYRMTDLMEGFADYPASMLACENKILDEADLVSITSMKFAFKLEGARREKMIYAPNGVDLEYMSAPRPKPPEYQGIEKPIAVYVGALREWFDWDLLAHVARRTPDVHYFIVSPDSPRHDLLALGNLSYRPGVAYEELAAYYQHAAVGMIPFADSPLVSAVNPIKMFECLAAGTSVVATEWAELRELEAPIRLARGPEAFARAIRAAVARSDPPDASRFLAGHSWEANLEALLARIAEVNAGRG